MTLCSSLHGMNKNKSDKSLQVSEKVIVFMDLSKLLPKTARIAAPRIK